jgi:hypothetical protein
MFIEQYKFINWSCIMIFATKAQKHKFNLFTGLKKGTNKSNLGAFVLCGNFHLKRRK